MAGIVPDPPASYDDKALTSPTVEKQSTIIDQWFLYDDALCAWIERFKHPEVQGGKPLPVILDTPDRAFADIRDILANSPDNRKEHNAQLELPLVSVFRDGEQLDLDRWNRAIFRKMGYVGGPDGPKKEIYQGGWPLPYILPYQIDIWARNREVLNYITQWMALQFDHHEFFLRIDFTGVHESWCEKIIPVKNPEWVDNSVLEPGEPDDRELRRTLNVQIYGWLFRPVIVRKTVLGLQIDVCSGTSEDPGDLLDTWTFPQ